MRESSYLISEELWEKIAPSYPSIKLTIRSALIKTRVNNCDAMHGIFFTLNKCRKWSALNATGIVLLVQLIVTSKNSAIQVFRTILAERIDLLRTQAPLS